MKFTLFILAIISTSIVVYNNMKQLIIGYDSIYDLLSLLVIICVTTFYYIYNSKKINLI